MPGDPFAGSRSTPGVDPAGSARSPRSVSRRHVSRSTQAVVAALIGLCGFALVPAQIRSSPVDARTQESTATAATAPIVALAATPGQVPADGQVLESGADHPADASAEPTSRIAVRTKTTKAVAQQQPVSQPALGQSGPAAAPEPAAAPAVYSKNLFDGSLFRYQNPDGTACTATATEVMLNFIASKGSRGDGFVWSPTTSYNTQESILAWTRANDTLDAGAPGSDPHGWRNALNYYGWGSFATFGARHYEDLSYSSYASAIKAAVSAVARENKPVGLLAWSGGHAQVLTGYEVYGSDPAASADFDVTAVYLSDPLSGDGLLNARITYANLQSGPTSYRFTPYAWTDSSADDPYMAGSTPSWREWYGKWVIIAPVSFTSASPGSH